ncbi:MULTISPECIES: SWIM zinc finger family protein [unclassified Streptomyces]|uniref:SWIM zinc finger family protein n=1 Tax=unclassified Streptomyces TaxID=2593676 RepID=UPI00380749D2
MDTPDPRPAADAIRAALRAARDRAHRPDDDAPPRPGGATEPASPPTTGPAPTPGHMPAPGAPDADPTGPHPATRPTGPDPATEPTGAVPEARSGPGEKLPGGTVPRTPPVPGTPAADRAPAEPASAEPRRARPADAARAALRRYTDGRRPTGRSDSPDAPTTPPDEVGEQSREAAGNPDEPDPPAPAPAAEEAAPSAPSAPSASARPVPETEPGDGTAARPGDAAREALRAARAQVRRAEAEAEETRRSGPRRSPRTAVRPAVRPSGAPRDPVSDARARDVRAFLTDAFRMPSESAETPGTSDTADHDEPSSAHPTTPDPTTPDPTVPAPTDADLPTPPDSAARAALAPRATPATRTTEPAGTAPPSARSMAAPSRDGDHRRTFAAFPPRSAAPAPAPHADAAVLAGAATPRFADTWWGNAWITALEDGALDAKRLVRGRSYAERGQVDAITVTPGLVLAYVQGSRARPYRVQVRLRTLGEADWERFLDAAVEHPAHIAALLDKEMPESLAECGVPLLPGPGDLEPQCSCPDRGHPCKHVAALCYQTARLLDADPFVLLLLRGRGEREVLDALSRRNATRAARAARDNAPEDLPGVRASEALAPRRRPPLPPPAPVPAHPGQPPAYPAVPGGPDAFALDQLATDAAARAHALLTTGRDEIGGLTLWQDAVRLAAARPGSGLTATTRALYASLASAAGRTPAELARAVAAWRQGGPDGLAVLEDPWDPPAGRFDRARPLLLAADLPAFRPWRNHLTHPRGHVQLRFGRDGLWYPYESEPGHDDWWPRGTADIDPVGALTGLGGTPGDADDI